MTPMTGVVMDMALPQRQLCSLWCAREDLNLHPLRDYHLKVARLPIPPLARQVLFYHIELFVA